MANGGLALSWRAYRQAEISRRVSSAMLVSVAAALAATLIAGAASTAVDRYLTGLLLNQVAARAVDHVQVAIEPRVQAADFDTPYTADKLEDVDTRLDTILTRARQDGSGIIRVSLLTRDGTVLYSDMASLRGQVVSPSGDTLMRGALAGNTGVALVAPGGMATADLANDYTTALEASVPVTLNGQVVGVYELYQDPAPVYALRPPVWGLGAVVAAVSFVLVRGVSRLVMRRRRRPGAVHRLSLQSNLTRREIQVLTLLAQGCTYRAIGDRLVISEETVRTHVKSILHKFGQPNRAGAVAAARRAGILT